MENFVVYREVVATYATIVQAESEEQAYEIIDKAYHEYGTYMFVQENCIYGTIE